jgi:hypothetical protein
VRSAYRLALSELAKDALILLKQLPSFLVRDARSAFLLVLSDLAKDALILLQQPLSARVIVKGSTFAKPLGSCA